MKTKTNLWQYFSKSLESVAAFILLIVAISYGFLHSDLGLLLASIALTLGLIASGINRDRRDREALGKQIGELKMSLPDRPSALAFFRPMKDFDSLLNSALHIDLCGVSLTNTLSTKFPVLRARIEAGAQIRVLVIDPNSHAIEMSSERSTNPKDTMYYQRRLESTFSELTYLHKFVEDIKPKGKRGTKAGSLNVKLLSYAPSFGLISLDSGEKVGMVQIEIFPHKFGFKARPIFALTSENDGEWYAYFVDQFEQMWNAAVPWDPSPYIEEIPSDNISS